MAKIFFDAHRRGIKEGQAACRIKHYIVISKTKKKTEDTATSPFAASQLGLKATIMIERTPRYCKLMQPPVGQIYTQKQNQTTKENVVEGGVIQDFLSLESL